MATTMQRSAGSAVDEQHASAPGARGALGVVLALLGIALAVFGLTAATEPTAAEVSRAVAAMIWAICAGAIGRRRPREPMGFVLLAFALAGAVWALAAALASDGSTGRGLRDAAVLVRALALGVIPAVACHALLGLPEGGLRTKARRVVVASGYAFGVIAGVLIWSRRPALPLWPVGAELGIAALAGAIASTSRYRRARGLERQRLQWFGWAVTVAVTVGILAGATRLLVQWPDDFFVVALVATIAIPLGLAMGSSQRLVSRIDRLLAATVAIGGLTGVVVLTYLLIVLGLGRPPTQGERTLLLLSMIAAVISALLYIPTRDRLTTLANRIVYGERHAPDEVLRSFGSRLSRAIPMDELLLQMAESLRKTFALDMVEVWTGTDGAFKRTISEPDRGMKSLQVGPKETPVVSRAGVSGNAWIKIWLPQLLEGRETSVLRVAPITHQGELLGMITIERRNADEPFNEENERVLTELARQVGLALHNAQLDSQLQATLDEVRRQSEEIRASRARIVAAGDAERRKLERNLHDGAQQHLVALKVKVRLLEQLQAADPANAKLMFEQLGGDIDDAVQALRDLAHGIYPPVLADRGLVPALESAATKAAISTTVAPSGDVARYQQEVEAAVYFCVLEALQNAGKHAGADANAVIHVRENEGVLEFDVADDGAGFDMAGKGLGAGFTNMSDRLGAIGGTLHVQSAPGQGTTISGRVPVSA